MDMDTQFSSTWRTDGQARCQVHISKGEESAFSPIRWTPLTQISPSSGGDVALQDVSKPQDPLASIRRFSDDQGLPRVTKTLVILYALVAGFTSANLYYSQPILHVLAEDFHVSQSKVASIPALAQAGEAVGLVAVLPLADFFPRRKFTLIMMAAGVIFW
jgi:hypothetical protein